MSVRITSTWRLWVKARNSATVRPHRGAASRSTVGSSQVHEEDHPVQCSCPLKILHEERGLLVRDAHSHEDYRELFPIAPDFCLPGDLGGELACRQAGAGEDRQLLAPDQRVEAVDCRHPGLDEVRGFIPGGWIDGRARDVEYRLGDDLRAVVPGLPDTAEDPAQHIMRDADPGRLTGKPDGRAGRVDAPG